MQRSSESNASLAAALAKAQAVLTNPEKSLVATIQPNGSGEAARAFRYAPLSSGLVRGMDLLGLADLRGQRDDDPAPDGRRADLRPPLRPVYARRHRRRGRH
jgi:hypothetical protein